MHDFIKFNELEKLLEFHSKGDFKSNEAKVAARAAYDNCKGDKHCIYWNDRFYIAVMWGLDEETQRESALQTIVGNGCKGYFTVITPAGFDNREALKKLKVSNYFIFGLSYGIGFPNSQELDFSIIDKVAGIFRLRETSEYGIAKRSYDRRVLFENLCKAAEERRTRKI